MMAISAMRTVRNPNERMMVCSLRPFGREALGRLVGSVNFQAMTRMTGLLQTGNPPPPPKLTARYGFAGGAVASARPAGIDFVFYSIKGANNAPGLRFIRCRRRSARGRPARCQ